MKWNLRNHGVEKKKEKTVGSGVMLENTICFEYSLMGCPRGSLYKTLKEMSTALFLQIIFTPLVFHFFFSL